MAEIKAEQVPDEVVEAFRDAWTRKLNARKTIAAALAAWPGRERDKKLHCRTDGTWHFSPRIILPLPPQEANDDKN